MPPPKPGGHGPGGHWSGSHRSGGHWSGGGAWFGGWGRYYRPTRGYRLSAFWLSPTYFVSNWGSYGLAAPGPGYRWVRYYDDAVLIDGRGNIMDARYGVDWGPGGAAGAGPRLDYDSGYDDGYDDGYGDASADAPRLGYDHGFGDGRYGFSNGSVIYAAPGVTTVVVQSAPVVTTTTTYEVVPDHSVRSKWRPSHRTIKRTPRCYCR